MISSDRLLPALQFYYKAKTKYHIQSPLVYEILTEILENKREYYCFEEIERIRYSLLNSEAKIEVKDFGAGSRNMKPDRIRDVRNIAATSLSPEFKCRILFNSVLYFAPKEVVELGTSLGISTLYLAKPASDITVHTIEASPQIQHIAKMNFDLTQTSNIKSHLGIFDDVLPGVLTSNTQLVYIDGNHTKEATLRYYELIRSLKNDKMVIIFDDIYWSKGMQEAWKEIEKDAPLTIDFYHLGFVLFSHEIIRKQNFTVIPYRFKPWQIGLFQ